jgi:hypothetical protein
MKQFQFILNYKFVNAAESSSKRLSNKSRKAMLLVPSAGNHLACL